MQNLDETTITAETIRRLENCTDPRLKTVLSSLITHLHDFAREVNLTEREWMQGIEFLTATGHKCDDKRQEFILLSDTLGMSMLTVALNHRKPPGCTEATVFGPFHVEGAKEYKNGDDISEGAAGDAAWYRGTVRGLDGKPIANAIIDVWQADGDGFYDVQYTDRDNALFARGRLRSNEKGEYWFKSILPCHYSIPTDGPVGAMMKASGRHTYRPAHMHFMLEAPGFEKLITHVFRSDDQYLNSDAVFGVRSSLIGEWKKTSTNTTPDGKPATAPFYQVDFDFVLNPAAR
jgi:hydroxyquinol 1,2-dioxygenase